MRRRFLSSRVCASTGRLERSTRCDVGARKGRRFAQASKAKRRARGEGVRRSPASPPELAASRHRRRTYSGGRSAADSRARRTARLRASPPCRRFVSPCRAARPTPTPSSPRAKGSSLQLLSSQLSLCISALRLALAHTPSHRPSSLATWCGLGACGPLFSPQLAPVMTRADPPFPSCPRPRLPQASVKIASLFIKTVSKVRLLFSWRSAVSSRRSELPKG